MRTPFPLVRKHWLLTAAVVACAASLAAAPRNSGAAGNGAIAAPEPEMPATLHIGDIEFQVKMQPFPDTYVGMTHFATRTVQIDPSSLADQRRRVYLHELLHVAWHEGRLAKDKSRKYTEEEAIQALTPGLLKMFEQNPQAVEYLRASSAAAPDNQLLRTTASK